MPTDLIRYDLLVQDALAQRGAQGLGRRGARRSCPAIIISSSAFRTRAPGVRLSNRMRDQYPEEMTIVLQHQFWDLVVGDHGFEVGLSFHGKSGNFGDSLRCRVRGFFDPSVDFGLKFEFDTEAGQEAPTSAIQLCAAARPAGLADAAPRLAAERQGKPRGSGSEPAEVGPTSPAGEAAKQPASAADAVTGMRPANEPNVVSIDAFRKKP